MTGKTVSIIEKHFLPNIIQWKKELITLSQNSYGHQLYHWVCKLVPIWISRPKGLDLPIPLPCCNNKLAMTIIQLWIHCCMKAIQCWHIIFIHFIPCQINGYFIIKTANAVWVPANIHWRVFLPWVPICSLDTRSITIDWNWNEAQLCTCMWIFFQS